MQMYGKKVGFPIERKNSVNIMTFQIVSNNFTHKNNEIMSLLSFSTQ